MAPWYTDRRTVLIALVSSVIAAIGVASSLDGLANSAERALLGIVNLDNGVVRIDWWAPYALVLLVAVAAIALVVGLALTVIAVRSARPSQALARAQDVIKGLLNANREIVDKLYTAEDYPKFVVEEMRCTMRIDRSGVAVVTRSERIRAEQAPVTFWTLGISVDAEANGAESFHDIKFASRQTTGSGKVVHLPVRDDLREKRVAVFPLPKLDATETEPRTIETSYRWPGLMNRLFLNGEAEWFWTLGAVRPVKLFYAAFYFEPSHGAIDCDLNGIVPKNGRLERSTDENGWSGWTYQCENAMADKARYAF
ncbi:MAG: hypothetical protein ACKOEC_03285 [Acidimicrobiia bacterium]